MTVVGIFVFIVLGPGEVFLVVKGVPEDDMDIIGVTTVVTLILSVLSLGLPVVSLDGGLKVVVVTAELDVRLACGF